MAFKFPAGFGGRKCKLRFGSEGEYFKTGGEMIRVFSFVPSGSLKTIDCNKSSWNAKNGYRDQAVGTFHYSRTPVDVYSFACPSSEKYINYELMPAGGDTNMQWLQSKTSGFYIEIV